MFRTHDIIMSHEEWEKYKKPRANQIPVQGKRLRKIINQFQDLEFDLIEQQININSQLVTNLQKM